VLIELTDLSEYAKASLAANDQGSGDRIGTRQILSRDEMTASKVMAKRALRE
jgi:hypothetical protein